MTSPTPSRSLSKLACSGLLVLGLTCAPARSGEAVERLLSLEEATQSLVDQLSQRLANRNEDNLAILEITGPGSEASELGAYLIAALEQGLLDSLPRNRLVERKRIEKPMEELHRNTQGLFDSAQPLRLGSWLGASVLVWGDIQTVGERALSISLSAIDTETSAVLARPRVLLGRAGLDPSLLGSLPPQPRGKPLGLFVNEPLEILVETLIRSRDQKQAVVTGKLINRSAEPLFLGISKGDFGRCSAHLSDDTGLSYLPMGDSRGTGGIPCVVKAAPKSDYTRVPPGEMALDMTFKSNVDDVILGETFSLGITFVQLDANGERQELQINVGDLRLE